MDNADCWLAASWALVRPCLPGAPARVVELGCGPLGGVVPALLGDGFAAVGVDPEAPAGDAYARAPFEEADLAGPFDAVVACVSLHHVADLGPVLDRVGEALVPGGTVVVVEWGWERFDGASAHWCFDRLAPAADGEQPTWLERHRDRWAGSGLTWEAYLSDWAGEHGLHRAADMLDALDARFSRTALEDLPYFFCDLAGTDRAAEQAAIDAGDLRPTAFRYVGTTAA